MKCKAEKAGRIFLIDDHPAVRQGLKLFLSRANHAVCGEAGCRAEVLALIQSSRADLALLDLSLGEENGLDLIAGLREAGIAVLVYSMHEDPDTIEKSFAAGAGGYVTKREMADVLLTAVSDLLAGKRHISPMAAQSLASKAISSREQDRENILSDREKEILAKLARGESNADIADALAVSVRTVESYCSRIIIKLGFDGMKQLRRYAITRSRR